MAEGSRSSKEWRQRHTSAAPHGFRAQASEDVAGGRMMSASADLRFDWLSLGQCRK